MLLDGNASLKRLAFLIKVVRILRVPTVAPFISQRVHIRPGRCQQEHTTLEATPKDRVVRAVLNYGLNHLDSVMELVGASLLEESLQSGSSSKTFGLLSQNPVHDS